MHNIVCKISSIILIKQKCRRALMCNVVGVPLPADFPTLWLSASNFDGAHANSSEVITGDVSNRTRDSVGNTVFTSGTIRVVDDGGHSAYYFDKTNWILSAAPVSDTYTFVCVFRRPSYNTDLGRFFTGYQGNLLFGAYSSYVGEFFVEGWVIDQQKVSTQIEFYIGTNAKGRKNVWDVRLDKQIVVNSTLGANVWGQTVIGKPWQFPQDAAVVYVYEALVYNYVLSSTQMDKIKADFTLKYRIFSLLIANIPHHKGVASGQRRKSPPPKPKNCCRKMGLFPNALFEKNALI